MNSKINKRLKDALFTDQWSELFMDVLSPFHFVLVRRSQRGWAAGVPSLPARQVDHGEGELDCRDGGRRCSRRAGWRDRLLEGQPAAIQAVCVG